MTKTSIANLKVCDKIGFQSVEGSNCVMVLMERSGNRAYVCGGSGPLVYEDVKKARRNIMRVRANFEPTTI